MRHLHFTQSLEPLNGGGLATSSIALHRQMLSDGVQSTLCSTHGGAPQNPVESCHEFHRVGPYFIYFSQEMLRHAPTLVWESDILHGHGFYTGTNFIFGREARRQNKALVYHVHGMFEPYILNRSRWKKNLVHWLFEDDNFKNVRLWRALTSKEADQIRSCGLTQPIVTIPNGIDMSAFETEIDSSQPIQTPLVPNLTKRKMRVLFLARIHPKKGLDLLLSAWARLGSAVNDWELVIAGPDEGGYMAQIQDLNHSLELEKQLLFIGSVSGETKMRLLRSADVFVLPSRSEGFSMSILEALACGIPTVATRACNCPDITRVQAGWECDTTVDSISESLGHALRASTEERAQRGANGRRLVEQDYSWSKISKTLIEAAQSIA